jgi:hypothetical protein
MGGWRKLHTEELHNLYPLPNIIRICKSKRMKLTGRLAYMGEMRNSCTVLIKSQKERDHWEDLSIDGRIAMDL